MFVYFRRNVKAKASEEKRKLNESGVNGLIGVKSNLDDVERRVVTIITPDVIDGDGESQERGFNRPVCISALCSMHAYS